ncbi:MAG TPA: transglutaminase-like domain-containing protein [Candidatus Acidoferrales bacterium]|nr:transglutaminase-like domain-containing protein [Candidatus Acidoferrales bacterium]
MRRIRIDYSLAADELYAELAHSIRNISKGEFERWIRKGKFDARMIDDTLRFVGTSRSNLFFRNSDIATRRIPPPEEYKFHEALLSNCILIEKASDSSGVPYVLPKVFVVKMSLTTDSGVVKPGETVKAWIPVPRKLPFQTGFSLVSSSSRPVDISSEESQIRSVYMEQPTDSEGATRFLIEYSYETFGVHFNLERDRVQPYNKSDSTYVKYTMEAPNLIFTDKITRLSKEIVGRESNPLLKAKKIYDWISRNIKYSFAREYSTISNISDYCLTQKYGDCGQEAMLFIALCRYNGIPTRWQSGWFTFPGAKDIHDWTEIYVSPYGWIPVDPYMGILAKRYMMDLTPEQRKILHEFYFGGLDQYRMSANSDNNQVLMPAKKYFRSDDVDFQRGELETDESNIYFNQFDYSLTIQEKKP